MFYDMGYQLGHNEGKAEVETGHHASEAAKQIERECSAKTGEAARECITEIVEAERESQRGESDLAAQWQAADWVMWAGVLAGAQLIATALGLYYVRETLRATLKAVKDTGEATDEMRKANDIALNAQRAWVSIDATALLARPDFEEGGTYFRFNVACVNVGGTAATHFGSRCRLLFQGKDEFDDTFNERIAQQVTDWRKIQKHPREKVLPPSVREIGPYWINVAPPELVEGNILKGVRAAYPILLVAVMEPDIIQSSWCTWLLGSIEPNGEPLTCLKLGGRFEADRLHLMPIMGTKHEEHAAKAEQPNVP